MPGLKLLELKGNAFYEFFESCRDDQSTSLFPSLTVLQLSSNHISEIPDKICLPKLQILGLEDNPLKTFLSGILLYRYRWHIRLLMFEARRDREYRWRRLQEQHFIYDVFVCYDNHDVDFVIGHLVPELEGRLGLRLCVHQRDFVTGNPIVENIMDSVETSKTTMMLFSRAFAESVWCQFELQLCLNHALEHDDWPTVVLLEDIPSRDLTPAMMAVMKTTTYIDVGG
nr:hypothetical protein BaRGS_019090 [Batillaria attramentaria]